MMANLENVARKNRLEMFGKIGATLFAEDLGTSMRECWKNMLESLVEQFRVKSVVDLVEQLTDKSSENFGEHLARQIYGILDKLVVKSNADLGKFQ